MQSGIRETRITDGGTYDISTEPSGISRIRLYPNWFDPAECASTYMQLAEELPWQQKYDLMNGRPVKQTRLTSWFGAMSFTYVGVTQEANPKWTPLLLKLKARVEQIAGCQFNSMLANLYEDGHDHVAWHTDEETAVGTTPTIASLSFGDRRTFQLRKKPYPGAKDDAEFVSTEMVEVPLASGALLIMEKFTNHDWQHRVPEEECKGPRINLTFRVTNTV